MNQQKLEDYTLKIFVNYNFYSSLDHATNFTYFSSYETSDIIDLLWENSY